jgi:adenylate cyclase
MLNVMHADRGTLYLIDREAGVLRSHVAKGPDGKEMRIEVAIDKSIAGRVVIDSKLLNVPDAYESPYFNPAFDRVSGYRTKNILCMPVFDEAGDIFAVAQLINRLGADRFTEKDEEQFQTFAEPLGVVLASCLHLRDQLIRAGGIS